MPTPAATASKPRINGLIPPLSTAAGIGGGASAGGGGGGAASTTGRTQPVGDCVPEAAAAAAAPHMAAAGAPPLNAERTAHGLACGTGAGFDAIATVELNISDDAANPPRTRLNPRLAMLFSPAQRVWPRTSDKPLVEGEVSFHCR
jgi:hypothetical protein